MNWKEFKNKVESSGVDDDMDIVYIDISPQDIMFVDIEASIVYHEDTETYEFSIL